ncbi:hypothetical protein MCOR07_001072 [Pyricularia oryzae]|nr:hypothetical protein MCOR19_008401 [Pyricularia oryzae]KAI6354220.1 hypothetical protein MCOR32_010598 [Pyricularia oryzae]KAI6400691.1 hypothetical protein MCOR20_008380 [Pyricularia oryzae]KAI6408521.1 hypothetical protein MCOR24_007382 [Pyricularia oryzae]KAI6452057.1 hypothetical protein MCOR22_000919 [Pyricularia oryzae]
MTSEVRPFKIAVPEGELTKLKCKLNAASFPPDTAFSDDWERGSPQADVKRLVARWKEGFDWRAAEAELNKIPQFTTSVDVDGFGSIEMHFVHQRSQDENAIPLLFCHGWPGGFWEVRKLLPLLTPQNVAEPSFHVVAPSHPNFGFSEEVAKPGFNGRKYAEAAHKVMLRLGYDKYVTQGGDWGYRITRALDLLYPENVLASHINMILADPPTLLQHPMLYLRALLTPHTAPEKAMLANVKKLMDKGMGYNLQQSTKPATIGFALADSPVALLAWQYEKLIGWSDDDYRWGDDEVLTWASLYVFSRPGPAASVRIYYEDTLGDDGFGDASGGIKESKRWNGAVPLGLSSFPRDMGALISSGRTLGPVVFERAHERGGHFPATERPEVLAGDLKDMFSLSPGGFGRAVQDRLKLK